MRVCIVAHRAYGALVQETQGHIGGVERQTRLFAHWLRDQGHQVSVITWNEGGPREEVIDAIRVIKVCAESDGLPGLRFFTPRWSSLRHALTRADAEVYYHNCAEYVTGQIGFWCKSHQRRFVYSVASDYDCRRDADLHKPAKDEWFFSRGLQRADHVICQTLYQQRLLRENYKVESEMIPMPGTPPALDPACSDDDRFASQKVLWVGRVQTEKRINWFLEIAARLTRYQFAIVGPPDLPEVEMARVLKVVDETPNLEYVGKIPGSEMPAIYQSAALLCCTSVFEGFPNTFLEAWSYGLPVVTTFDPDNLVAERGLGLPGQDPAELSDAIKKILGDRPTWSSFGDNARRYFAQYHEPEKVMGRFEAALTGETR